MKDMNSFDFEERSKTAMPVFLNQTTSKGNQRKFELNGYFYKIDYLGYESIAEFLVSELESCIADFDFVSYKLENVNCAGEYLPACVSRSFNDGTFNEITLYAIIKDAVKSGNESQGFMNKYQGRVLVDHVIHLVEKMTKLTAVQEYFGRIIYLDALTLNNDRHLNNISFKLFHDDSWDYMPVYDNGGALLSDETIYPISEKPTAPVKSKPFSTSFKKQVEYFRDDVAPLRIDIKQFHEKITALKEQQYKLVPFKSAQFQRALSILQNNLDKWEGKLWVCT